MSEASEFDRSEPVRHEPAARGHRANVMLMAKLEHPRGREPTSHPVRNLAGGGVRIENASRLQVGSTVLFSAGSLDAIEASVVWVRGDAAGLAFARPVDPELARKKGSATRAEQKTLRRNAVVPSTPPTNGWFVKLRDAYR